MDAIQSVRRLNNSIEAATRLTEFYGLCKCIALGKGELGQVDSLCRSFGLDATRANLLQRSAQSAATTSNTSALTAVGQAVTAFLQSLSSISAYDAMLPNMRRMPMNSRAVSIASGVTASPIEEMAPVHLSSGSMTSFDLAPKKVVAMIAVTNEILRFGTNASDVFGNELRSAVAKGTDQLLTAALIAGAGHTAASAGSTPTSIRMDLRNALANMGLEATSALYILMSPLTAAQVSTVGGDGVGTFPAMTPAGGRMFGIETLVTSGISDGTVCILDARQIGTNGGNGLVVNSSTEATLQMDSAPDSPFPTAATVEFNLFQANAVALKAQRDIAISVLRSTAVSIITGVDWSNGSP